MNNLLNFPQSTFVDKLIPKAKFVKASDTPTAMRDLLTEEFEQIRLMYVLRADTLNIEPGNEVSEIDFFYLKGKREEGRGKSNPSVYTLPLSKIDMLIPRHTLYIIDIDNSLHIYVRLKEISQNGKAIPKSDWIIQKNIDINFISTLRSSLITLHLDKVYFNLLCQVSGYHVDNAAALQAIKDLEDEIAKKRRQVEVLQKKVRAEKQFNKQIELNALARSLKRDIADMTKKLSSLK